MSLPHGSGFHGYGGTGMAAALTLGPLDLRWCFDVKPAAVALHRAHRPDVPNLGDMTAAWPVDPDRRDDPASAHHPAPVEVEPVLVRTDSWPCQPHSSAGKRLGEADPRALWPNVARSIAVTRPAVWLGENVARCVRTGELARIERDLVALGYVVAWCTQRADVLGACHRRDRLFVVALDLAHPDLDVVLAQLVAQPWWTSEAPGEVEPLAPLLPTPTARLGERHGASSPDGAAARLASGRRNLDDAVALLPTPTARDGKGANMPGWRLDAVRPDGRARTLGDADLPSVVAFLPTPTTRNARGADQRGRRHDGGGCAPDLQTVVAQLDTLSDTEPDRFGRYAAAVARHGTLLGRPAPDPSMVGVRGKPQLNPWFVEWMMCLPHGHVAGVDDLGQARAVSWRPRALSLLGDGVVPAQGATAYRRLLAQLVKRHLGLRREVAA